MNWLMQPASWLVAGLLGLAGCQSNTATKAENRVTEKPVAAVPAPPAAPVGVGPPFVGYHRYRGTVGGQPVTVELTIGPSPDAHDSIVCQGRYFYGRHSMGQLLLRAPHPYRASQLLALMETDSGSPRQLIGRWQASQVAGPLLSGAWRSPDGRQLPFELREDYTDGQGHLAAVHYELVNEATDALCHPERREGETKAEYDARAAGAPSGRSMDFLHLLGPDSLRPALRALQCPVPAKRRQLLQEAVNGEDCEEESESIQVDFNDYGLLVITTMRENYSLGMAHPAHDISQQVHDLRSGHQLTRKAIFRPGTETALSRLIMQHLREDEHIMAGDLISPADADSTLVSLPGQEFGVVPGGLEFQYNDYEIAAYVYGPPSVVILYAELLPLLRPDSPVARMLRERGLWRNSKKQ